MPDTQYYTDIQSSVTGSVSLSQSAEGSVTDAFGRLRVSNPTSLFYSSLGYGLDVQDDIWATRVVGTASATSAPATSSVLLTTLAAADDITLQTYEYFRYQPGKSQLVKITGSFGTGTAGVTKWMGYGDDANGIFIKQNGASGIQIVIRKYGNDTAVDQADWNIATFPNYDFTKAFIFLVDIEWLGVGTVRCGFAMNGVITWAHHFHHDGVVSLPYMRSASLPIRYRITQTGATGGTMNAICSAVDSEGGSNVELGHAQSGGNGITTRSVTTALPVVAIRPALLHGGITNRVTFQFTTLDVYVTTNPILVQVYAGTTVTGGSWAAVNTHSAAEINVGGTAFSGGHPVDQYVVPVSGAGATSRGSNSRGGFTGRIPLALNIAGNDQSRHFAVVCTAPGGGAPTAVNVDWLEIH